MEQISLIVHPQDVISEVEKASLALEKKGGVYSKLNTRCLSSLCYHSLEYSAAPARATSTYRPYPSKSQPSN